MNRFIISKAHWKKCRVCVCVCVCAHVRVCVWCWDSLNICDMSQMLRESDAYVVKCILLFHPLFIFYHTCWGGSATCHNYLYVWKCMCLSKCVCVTPSDVMWYIRRFWCLGVKNPIRGSGTADRYLTGSRLMLCVCARACVRMHACMGVCVCVCVCVCMWAWKCFNTSQRWISARQHGDTVRQC